MDVLGQCVQDGKMGDMKKYKVALSIAGSDPSGGAGLQADLKTFSACGCYGATAVVAVVDENTVGVTGVFPIPVDFVAGQIRSVLDDLGADAVDTLKSVLVPYARVITPNIPEAEILLGEKISFQSELPECARRLSQNGNVSVLLKAGHLSDEELTDVFYNAETGTLTELKSRRVNTQNTHGTGCTLSSAICAYLSQGAFLPEAVKQAKSYLNQALTTGCEMQIGKGAGPVNHFFAPRPLILKENP